MKIVVVASQSLDAEEPVRIAGDRVDLSASKLTLDKMDEYGVEESLRLREAGLESEIVVVGAGSGDLQSSIRAALALGADRAVHIKTEDSSDVLATGNAIAAICQQEQADIVLVGGQQGALDTHALGPVIAERLNWPQVTWVTALEWDSGTLKGKHDVDDGQENFEVEPPVVLTAQQGLNEPRYPTVPNIRRSHLKEVRETDAPSDNPSLSVLEQILEARPRMGSVINGKDPQNAAARLVCFLRDEAKVIA